MLDPTIAKAFLSVSKFYAEDTLHTGAGGGAVDNNPYADATANQTEQMRLYRSDPDKARRLISAAGKTPGDFGLQP